jgi:hypothetical protein
MTIIVTIKGKARDDNPNHEPAGSGKGGQFTAGGGTTRASTPAKKTDAEHEAETRVLADKLKTMSEAERDEISPYDYGYRGYALYEAEKLMPKKDGAFKTLTDNNSFVLHNEADAVVNINGKAYLATKEDDPDDEDDGKELKVWNFSDPTKRIDLGFTSAWLDKEEAVKEFKQHLAIKPATKDSIMGKTIHIHIHSKTTDEQKHAPAGSSKGGQFVSGGGSSGGGGSKQEKAKANARAANAKTSAAKQAAITELKKHPMFSQPDLDYLQGKGYEPEEIKALWDRDHKAGNKPQMGNKHAKPGQPGYMSGHTGMTGGAPTKPAGISKERKDAHQVGAGIQKVHEESDSGAKQFPVGSLVRRNMQGAKPNRVTGHTGNIVHTDNGDFHVTKLVKHT